MFLDLEKTLLVEKEKLIELITWCSAGIIFGMSYFSTKINSGSFYKYNYALLAIGVLSSLFSTYFQHFLLMNIGRFILGVGIGICSSMAWWYSFNISKVSNFYNILIMSSRPISIALGVPILFYLNQWIGWVSGYLLLSIVGPFLLVVLIKTDKGLKAKAKSLDNRNFLSIYIEIFKNSNSVLFYGSIVTNAIGYLGFFVLLPFIDNLSLELKEVFFIMGIVEILGTLLSKFASLAKVLHFRFSCLFLLAVPLVLFLLKNADAIIYLLPIYLISVRIYIVNIANMIPRAFNYLSDSSYFGVCGSLIGVFAWIGLGIISYALSFFLQSLDAENAYLIFFIFNLISILFLVKLRRRFDNGNS